MEKSPLRRALGLPGLTLYGLGTILGAGIYVLVGKVAGSAGIHAPLSFVFSSVLAGLSALSFAELSSRYPKSAGEALYVQEAFSRKRLSTATGLLVAATGLTSAATIANGFAGYVGVFAPVPDAFSITGLVLVLGLLAAWGISESVFAAGLFTLIEVGGLLLVAWAGREGLSHFPLRWGEIFLPEAAALPGVLAGALFSFYAFIGFEDMVNVAEEVKDAPRTLPRAIVLALAISTFLYVLVALACVLSVPLSELSESRAPLALVWEKGAGGDPRFLSLVGLFAVSNGALVQIVMASRVFYGLSELGWLPKKFGEVHPRTKTPVFSTLLAAGTVLLLALAFPLGKLAQATSLITLLVFTTVNAALVRIKIKHAGGPSFVRLPMAVPVLGALSCAGFLISQIVRMMG
ncbi:MAG: APC family permease [Bdellovibrionota bacterium]